jgi:serine protease Do
MIPSSQGFGPDHPFFQFMPDQRQFRTPRQGLGSGVIVTKDGYILTNNHVVDEAEEVRVTTSDGREHIATVIGKDPKTDVAVLKIDAENLAPLPVGDSDQIQVGDLVLAVGNPFGVGQTVTMGMVSATGRAHMGMEYEDFIQTDAAINPGNSGGALVDADGRLVGINTAILSRTGGNQGIGFAIPSNLARIVLTGLVENGKVVRGFLGVSIQDVTPALAEQFELKNGEGALVGDVTANSPAAKAGVESGDIVVEFQGKSIKSSRQLKLMVSQTVPGTKVSLKVLREGKEKKLAATVKELPDSKPLAKRGDENDESSTELLAGIQVQDLDSRSKRQFQIPAKVDGVIITDVEENSQAYAAGLRPGNVIQEANRRKVTSTEDLEKIETGEKSKVLLKVWSQGGTRYVVV